MKFFFMMSKSWTTFVLSMALFLITSCEKSNDEPDVSVQGLWIGTVSNSTNTQFFALSIKPDGKLTFEGFTSNQEQFGAGTWTLNGAAFTATVTTLYGFASNIGVQQALTANFSKSNETLTGTYQITSPVNDSGSFSLTKVK